MCTVIMDHTGLILYMEWLLDKDETSAVCEIGQALLGEQMFGFEYGFNASPV